MLPGRRVIALPSLCSIGQLRSGGADAPLLTGTALANGSMLAETLRTEPSRRAQT